MPGPYLTRGLLIILAASVLAVVLWKVPELQLRQFEDLEVKDRASLVDEYRKTLAQILGGFALLFGLYLTWRRIAAAEKTAEATLKSAETALQNVRVAQDSQITERFTRAIGQLGHDKLEIRLGGIYALERIARDSETDHWPVMEVLTAYVRENAPWKENSSPSKQVASATSDKQAPAEEEQSPPDDAPNPRTDVQAILTVLQRRERSYEKQGQILDLRKTNLRTADLRNAHLEKAILYAAHLEKADLAQAHLEKAMLVAAHLEKADLRSAHLEGAHLLEAYLEGADLSELFPVTAPEAHLTQEQINQASGDKGTKPPEGLQTPKHWLKDSGAQ